VTEAFFPVLLVCLTLVGAGVIEMARGSFRELLGPAVRFLTLLAGTATAAFLLPSGALSLAALVAGGSGLALGVAAWDVRRVAAGRSRSLQIEASRLDAEFPGAGLLHLHDRVDALTRPSPRNGAGLISPWIPALASVGFLGFGVVEGSVALASVGLSAVLLPFVQVVRRYLARREVDGVNERIRLRAAAPSATMPPSGDAPMLSSGGDDLGEEVATEGA